MEKENFVISDSFELEAALLEIDCDNKKYDIIRRHIENVDEKNKETALDFEPNWEWLNTSTPLSLKKDLHGKIVVLDFFTYCCINCMHVLPDLENIEKQYSIEDGVVVIGVHSAKFTNEKLSDNIKNAVLRYNITHPVVNDADAKIWTAMGIQCWPTFVVLGPNGQQLLHLIGEGHGKQLQDFVKVAIDHYRSKDLISDRTLPLKLLKEDLEQSALSYPGKVSVSKNGMLLAIADTGHHRILITDRQGTVKFVIGGSSKGNKDGSFENCQFYSPQGVTWFSDSILYVADTENHTVRKLGLESESVETVAGTSIQGKDKEGGKTGVEQPISSPWDLTIGKSPGSATDNVLFIAMAGTHQLWVLFLDDTKWYKGSQHKQGVCLRFAGSGNEENRNNNYPHNAGFAQPSGITIGGTIDNPCLFVADSESSTVRMVTLKNGAVKALIGGERDPTNLFAFGDKDGKGYDVRLQHPLAVTMQSPLDGHLLVADSYNHKIKSIDINTKACSTIIGSGQSGDSICSNPAECQLNEPGGLSMDHTNQLLYIADTNNHTIKLYDFETNTMSKLQIQYPDTKKAVDVTDLSIALSQITKPKRITPKSARVIEMDCLAAPPGGKVVILPQISLSGDLSLTDGAPSAWLVSSEDEKMSELLAGADNTQGLFLGLEDHPMVTLTFPPSWIDNSYTELTVEYMLYYCDNIGVCKMKGIVFKQPIHITSTERTKVQSKMFNYNIDS
ncbi:unnamed protein product [Owenia fusiformis]|uniref:Uncharacterized protein n=1 Tax=Owenia fusiformis TaxID=6347 RepID=A0A8J1T5I3_OWEFU|nr:unnamed protein product [Owenia fusiformis]